MPAGLTLAVKVIRQDTSGGDDDVGGAVPTGTIIHLWVDGSIDPHIPKTDYSGQGLETIRTFDAMFWGNNLQIREQDEVEVVSPPNHQYFGKRFRVEAGQYDRRHPAIKQGYYLATLTRSQVAHSEWFQ